MKLKLFGIFASLGLIVASPLAFIGCGEPETVKAGDYKVMLFALDNVSQTGIVGQYATISGSTMLDWDGRTASVELNNQAIKITWQDENRTMVYEGAYLNDTITISQEIEGQYLNMVLKYEEDIVVKNGNYQITAYSINGNVMNEYIGKTLVKNGNSLLDWESNTVAMEIKGETIYMNWVNPIHTINFSASYTNDSIIINQIINGDAYYIVFDLI